MDNDKCQLLIITKCNLCFRKDANQDRCLLVKERHPGIELCLGPFKDQEDRLKKLHEDFEREKKPRPDFKRIAKDAMLNRYQRNKKQFDE